MTVDPKKFPSHYVIRAWCYGETSYLLDYGTVLSLDDIPRIAATKFGEHKQWGIARVVVDAGWEGRRIEDFCRKNNYVPIKGERSLPQGMLVDWGETNELKIPQIRVNTVALKDALNSKIEAANGSLGSWYLPQETPTWRLGKYLHQLTSEAPIRQKNAKGFEQRWYEPLHDQNHLLDCEVYQLAASIIFKIKSMNQPAPFVPDAPPRQVAVSVERSEKKTHFDRLQKYKYSPF